MMIKILPRPGNYYVSREPLFLASMPVDDNTANEVRAAFIPYNGEDIEENPVLPLTYPRGVKSARA